MTDSTDKRETISAETARVMLEHGTQMDDFQIVKICGTKPVSTDLVVTLLEIARQDRDAHAFNLKEMLLSKLEKTSFSA